MSCSLGALLQIAFWFRSRRAMNASARQIWAVCRKGKHCSMLLGRGIWLFFRVMQMRSLWRGSLRIIWASERAAVDALRHSPQIAQVQHCVMRQYKSAFQTWDWRRRAGDIVIFDVRVDGCTLEQIFDSRRSRASSGRELWLECLSKFNLLSGFC